MRISINKFIVKIVKGLLNNAVVKGIVLYMSEPLLYLYSYLIYRLISKKVNTKNKIPGAVLRIGIASYPHNKKNNYDGGDSTVNSLIVRALEEQGHVVEILQYDPNFIRHSSFIKRIIAKTLGMPYIFSELLNKTSRDYDLIIIDSGINFHINHPVCINLFHYSFGGYRKRAGVDWGIMPHLRYMKYNIIQKLGARRCTNVAVSDFIKNILEENNIRIDHVIYNSIDTEHFKPMKHFVKRDFLYAGGFAYYGKGIDLLEKLAEKGLNIDCVTNRIIEKCKLNFLPTVPHKEMPEVYNRYKILLFPSRFESFGMVPVEAMACGLPVIMGEVGIGLVLRECIPDFIVKGHDNGAIEEYISKAELIMMNYSYYSKKAREIVIRKFSYPVFRNKWCELIEQISILKKEKEYV